MRFLKSIILASTAATLLSGCTDINRRIESKTAQASAEADRNIGVLRGLRAHQGPANVHEHEGIWLGNTGIAIPTAQALPQEFSTGKAVTLNTNDQGRSLDQLANRLSELTGIRHSVEGVALYQGIDARQAQQNTASGDPFDPAVIAGPIAGVSASPMKINYTGSLASIEQRIADHFNVDWEYRDGVVNFIGVRTKTFVLEALPAQVATSAQIQGGLTNSNNSNGSSSSTAGGGNSAQSSAQVGVTSSYTSNYWAKVESALKTILPPNVPYSINSDTGTFTITARPSILRQVEKYVNNENRLLNRQVEIAVKVLSVSYTEAENYNFDPSLMIANVAKGFSLAYGGMTPLSISGTNAVSTTNGSSQIIGTGSTAYGSAYASSGTFAGSQAFISALASKTHATLKTQASVTALNNQVTPISVLNQQGYLQSRTDTTVAGSTNASVSLNPGTISTGFSMTVTPRILENDDLLLAYNISLSNLNAITQIGTSDVFIQAPNVDSRSLLESVRLHSGDTLVLAGFEQTNAQQNNQGVGSPSFWFLGGGTNASNNRQMIIIVITPVILGKSSQLQAADR